MTKKDYELIAQFVRNFDWEGSHITSGPELQRRVADSLAWYLESTNSRFDRQRFVDASLGRDSTDSAGRTVRYSRDPSPFEVVGGFNYNYRQPSGE